MCMSHDFCNNNCSHTFPSELMIFGALFKPLVAMLTWCMWCCRSSLQSDWLKGWAVLARAGKTYPKSRYHKLYCHFWKRQEWVAARWVLSRTPATEKSLWQHCWRLRKTLKRPQWHSAAICDEIKSSHHYQPYTTMLTGQAAERTETFAVCGHYQLCWTEPSSVKTGCQQDYLVLTGCCTVPPPKPSRTFCAAGYSSYMLKSSELNVADTTTPHTAWIVSKECFLQFHKTHTTTYMVPASVLLISTVSLILWTMTFCTLLLQDTSTAL